MDIKILSAGIFLGVCTGCQLVTAQGEMIFKEINNWQDLGEIAPNLVTEIRKIPLLDNWVGDPKKMQVLKIDNFGQKNSLYLVNTTVGYPNGIETVNDEMDDYYRPLCNMAGECSFLIYKKTEKGYALVFNEQLAFTNRNSNTDFLFTNTLYQGYPQCFEALGYDQVRRSQQQVPVGDGQLVSRYCYNGSEYQFERIYLKKVEKN